VAFCLTGDLQNIDRAGCECERAGLQEFHTSQAGEKVSEPLSITFLNMKIHMATWGKKYVYANSRPWKTVRKLPKFLDGSQNFVKREVN
jgi:hypothetical protein